MLLEIFTELLEISIDVFRNILTCSYMSLLSECAADDRLGDIFTYRDRDKFYTY